jgi:hypothetical protein
MVLHENSVCIPHISTVWHIFRLFHIPSFESHTHILSEARGSLAVKSLSYKPEGRGFETLFRPH